MLGLTLAVTEGQHSTVDATLAQPALWLPRDRRAYASGSPQPASLSSRVSDPLSLLPNSRICGIQNNDRIVGGTQADIDEHPWMALIRYDKRNILNGGQCIDYLRPNRNDSSFSWTQVRLGEWNTSSSVDCFHDDCSGPVQDIPVEEIIAQENYDPQDSQQHHDIAILRLAYNAQFNDFVKPICLPLSNELRNSLFEGFDMEVAGWGKTETRTESDVKLKVRVPIVNVNRCASVYQRVSRTIDTTQICAGGVAGQDSCRGDSGGPLMGQAPSANNWMVIGVVSYGPAPCGTQGWPGVYTRVGAYIDWILSKLRP
ncbi:hypothetical protein HF086_003430 [Spodoptera exigua]|uniref:Peptidase S1 domain-containing protein n=1 Tax=Spodoptera exigua TaxID=7107 RepID=A0A922MGP8_SPOEX|nr:hypothetical protein HF086_003430 [Spodoptera exigua]